MRRWLVWMAAAVLLVSSLFSCGEDLTPSPYGEGDFAQEGAVLSVEHEQYDKSVESFNYMVENTGERAISFGAEYAVEVERNGQWYALPLAENAGWNEIGYVVAPGEVWENSFSFLPYRYTVSDGHYRLIKEIGGKRYCAEFQIGGGEEQARYGYRDLEQLSLDLEDSEIDCDLRIDAAGKADQEGEERVQEFLGRVSGGSGDMLRIVSTAAGGRPVIYDVIFENGHFLLRRDDRRCGGTIQDRRYSFLVTDGEAVYLSDRAALAEEPFDGRRISTERWALLHRDWFADWEAVASVVEELTAKRLADSVTLARFWSEDGTYWVDLSREGLDYTVSTKGYGMSRTITDWGEDGEIIAVRWESPTQLRLFGGPKGAGEGEQMGWYAVFDVEQEQVVVQGSAMLSIEQTQNGGQ